MILKEFTLRGPNALDKLTRALAENYDYNLKFTGMTRERARRMADKARARVAEHKDLNQRIKFNMIAESLDLWMQANVQTELTSMVAEGLDDESMEEAKVILAAKELSDKIQGMIEDAAKMQVQDLLPIVDAMKSEVGSAEADSFATAADAALAGLVEALKGAKTEYDNAIGAAQGQAPATDMDGMGGMDDLGGDMGGDEMGSDMDGMGDMDDMGDDIGMDDEFGGDDANAGEDDPTGRAMKDDI
jgi:hypothetical protein